MSGLNMEPGQSYSLKDRFVCNNCGGTPQITATDGRDPIQISFECCGQRLTKSFSKHELVFTQYVFEKKED